MRHNVSSTIQDRSRNYHILYVKGPNIMNNTLLYVFSLQYNYRALLQ